MMSRRVGSTQFLALCMVVLLAAAGCSNMPTAPQASIDQGSAMNVTGGSQSEVLGLTLGGTSSTTTKTATIGLLGGVMSVGDFTLVIPPAALTRTATVTMSQPDLAHPVVNLSISPATANRFLVPVLLTAKAKRLDPALLSIACISYYNPATGQWERVAGTSVSVLNTTVSAPLWHFSTYRVSTGGKAGW
jgi:hypothetical protein